VHKTARTIAGIIAVVASAQEPARAQGFETQTPRNGACFYEDTNFRGRYFCVSAGDSMQTVAAEANDKVSSVRVLGAAEVTAFRDVRFQGQSLVLSDDVDNLRDRGFDNMLSSVRVRQISGGGGVGRGRPPGGTQNPDVIVRRAYQDILGRDPDPSGLRTFRSRIIDDGWTEQQVRQSLRESDEYREKNTMTMQKARDIVRQAYLSVLNREPDPASESWVQRVYRDRWSQAQVEAELRKSPEYRNR